MRPPIPTPPTSRAWSTRSQHKRPHVACLFGSAGRSHRGLVMYARCHILGGPAEGPGSREAVLERFRCGSDPEGVRHIAKTRKTWWCQGSADGLLLSGRALPSHGRGHRFEPCVAHQNTRTAPRRGPFFLACPPRITRTPDLRLPSHTSRTRSSWGPRKHTTGFMKPRWSSGRVLPVPHPILGSARRHSLAPNPAGFPDSALHGHLMLGSHVHHHHRDRCEARGTGRAPGGQ